MIKTTYRIFVQTIPVIAMIGAIPLVHNDYLLSALDALIIACALFLQFERLDILFFAVGFVVLAVSEYFFITTGVEVFVRRSLLGVMPLWLPLLWGYAFIVIRRCMHIVEDSYA